MTILHPKNRFKVAKYDKSSSVLVMHCFVSVDQYKPMAQ